MALDRTDVRSTMASYGASTRPPAGGVQPGAEFSRAEQPDEHVILLPERDGAALEVTTDDGTTAVPAYSITFVPAGRSQLRVTAPGRLVQLFSHRSDDLMARASNAAAYAQPHPNVAPLEPWPDPVGGFRVRTYSLDIPRDKARFGNIFRCTTFMVNYLDGSSGPSVRFPWTSNLAAWLDDDHTRIGPPSVAVIPPPSATG
jgi:hypothetical protein